MVFRLFVVTLIAWNTYAGGRYTYADTEAVARTNGTIVEYLTSLSNSLEYHEQPWFERKVAAVRFVQIKLRHTRFRISFTAIIYKSSRDCVLMTPKITRFNDRRMKIFASISAISFVHFDYVGWRRLTRNYPFSVFRDRRMTDEYDEEERLQRNNSVHTSLIFTLYCTPSDYLLTFLIL